MAKRAVAPPEKVELYDKLVATIPEANRMGDITPYTSVNGKMFSYLHVSGAMALRLPDKVRQKFLKKYKTTLFDPTSLVQQEYVRVPDSLLAKTEELRKYFEISYDYVKGLESKATAGRK
jgi:hypothetical protein